MEDASSFQFSFGSLFVLAACVCWGLENNCTRRLSKSDPLEIVMIKGVGSGIGSIIIGLVVGESLPVWSDILKILLLGFVAYGLSIFTYIRAQNTLGAAKTSAYYAAAPFIGAFLSFVILREPLTISYLIALAVMLAGAVLVVQDTLVRHHAHEHVHYLTHSHGGAVHTHKIVHSHGHDHYLSEDRHGHRHSERELRRLSGHA